MAYNNPIILNVLKSNQVLNRGFAYSVPQTFLVNVLDFSPSKHLDNLKSVIFGTMPSSKIFAGLRSK